MIIIQTVKTYQGGKKLKKGTIRSVFLKIVFMSVFLFAGLSAESFHASASSAEVSVEASSGQIVKGDIIYVIITVRSSDAMSGFEGYFSYDSRVLQYITGGSVVSGNDNSFQISDTGRETGVNTLKYSVKFAARKEGGTSIELKQPYAVYNSEDSSKMSVSSDTLNIMVMKKQNNEAANKSTKEPDKKDKKKNDEVKKDKSAEKNKSTMPPGSTSLPQKSELKLQASLKPQKKTDDDKKVIDADKSVTASYQNSVTTIHFYDEYKVVDVKDEKDIPTGFGKTEIVLGGHVITAYATEGEMEHTYVLIYCKRGREKPEFYLYDTMNDSFMPYERVKSWYKGAVGNEVVGSDSIYVTKIKTMKYIVAIMVVICLLMFIGMITIYLHYRENNNIIDIHDDNFSDYNKNVIEDNEIKKGDNKVEHVFPDEKSEKADIQKESPVEEIDNGITHYWKRD